MGWMARVQFLAGERHFSLLHSIWNKLVLGALSLKEKLSEHEADHSPPSSTKVKNGGAIPPLHIHLHGMVVY
jgi:hypothetical protein